MNAVDKVGEMERELERLEKERVKVAAANDAAIQAERNRPYFDANRQAEAVKALQDKRDAVLGALDRIRERKSAELEAARAELSAIQARQNDELEKQAAKAKERAKAAFIQAGGRPAEFEAQWPAILAARTARKLDETRKPLIDF
jgi:hypothetical protein